MFVVVLSSVFTLAALIVVLGSRRLGRRGRVAAFVFLLIMIGFDIWVARVLLTDPAAWTRQTCGWIEGKSGWRQTCL